MSFDEIVSERYAAKSFNGKKIPQDRLDALLEMIRLAPTSFNLQAWKVKVVDDHETREKLLPHSWNQPQVTGCSHLLVFCANMDMDALADRLEEGALKAGAPAEKFKVLMGMIRGFISKKNDEQKLIWAQKQIYIALAHGMLGAQALGLDACPMEGFEPDAYSRILELPKHLVPTVVLPVGYADDTPRPKFRFGKEDLFF